MNHIMHTSCLNCGKPAVSVPFGLDGLPYMNYSYCEDCISKAMKLLKHKKMTATWWEQNREDSKKPRWIGCSRCGRTWCVSPNVPYEEWAEYLIGLLKEYGIKDGLVAELGCGTGTMTRLLAKAGYDMIGIDLSEEMLDIARYDHPEAEEDILYLHQHQQWPSALDQSKRKAALCAHFAY